MAHDLEMKKCDSYGYGLERAIVSKIIETYETQGMNHASFARLLYGENDTAPVKWRRIRRLAPTGKPQGFPLHEAATAARLLGLDFYSLVFKVEESMKP